MSNEAYCLLAGFFLYLYTDIIFSHWRGKVLWKIIVLMLTEVTFFFALSTWLSLKYPDLANYGWLTSTSASIFAVALPFLSIVLAILKEIILVILRSLWSLTNIQKVYLARDAKNEWVRYLLVQIKP